MDHGECFEFGEAVSDLSATVVVHDIRFYRAIALEGGLGAADAYQRGFWSCDDLARLLQIFARNLQASRELGGNWKSILAFGRRIMHRLKRNTRRGSRRNIAAHYDLSNEFYAAFLDETMTYSAGIFPHAECSMQEASIRKYDRICRKLALSPGDRVLEIGTGWGGFAVYAAENYGCHITTTTISRNQHEYALRLFEARRLGDRVRLLQDDYRELSGEYDKLVSIEMIEAVGHGFLDTFFAKCSSLLKSDGLMVLQAITIPDQRYAAYLKSVDFIQRYIFPGGCLPSQGAMLASTGRVTDMQLVQLEEFAEHYATTLRCWREKFHENLRAIRELEMTEQFLRLWDYYLCYCEAGFREKQVGVCQLLLRKPRSQVCCPFAAWA